MSYFIKLTIVKVSNIISAMITLEKLFFNIRKQFLEEYVPTLGFSFIFPRIRTIGVFYNTFTLCQNVGRNTVVARRSVF